jgi:hypothetical protein
VRVRPTRVVADALARVTAGLGARVRLGVHAIVLGLRVADVVVVTILVAALALAALRLVRVSELVRSA